jgi:glycosyltransferase involved in cell wall biosynthesis
MRIALVVQGRFHAFDLAAALIRQGHTVRVLTNYPAWAAEPFGVERSCVTSFPLHGGLSRAAWKLRARAPSLYPEATLHRMFGSWAADVLQREAWDIVHPWSGIAEECLTRRVPNARYLLMRGSAHIRTQAELLQQEQERTGTLQEQPSAWMMAREEREYLLADDIITLSAFARRTFLERGFDATCVWNLPLAASAEQFRPAPEIVAERGRRIMAGERLRVLYVGTLSFRKGLWDLATVARALDRKRFLVRCVGSQTGEVASLVAGLQGRIEFVQKQPQQELPAQYAWGDVFLFSTIEDGYALVLAQAQASGLVLLSTENSGAPDLVADGETGWLFPIRRPDLLVERLQWCDTHRAALAAMVQRTYDEAHLRTWDDVARDFEGICKRVRGMNAAA